MFYFLKDNIGRPFFFIWSSFLKGLLTILPIMVTIFLISFTFSILKKWLNPIYRLEPTFLQAIPFSEFLLTFFFICLIGIIIEMFFLKVIWEKIENFIGKIPLVRPIYTGIKQLVHAFNPAENNGFKQAVIVEFPTTDVYSIGFITSDTPLQLTPYADKEYYNVFIPLTPNPTAGFFVIVPKEKVTITNLTRQEAISLILSSGIIQPAKFNVKEKNS